MTKIVERNTTIPVRRSETFSTADDNQSAVDIVVLQGEREKASENRVLGRFRLEDIRPARRGEPQIEVIFDIDANGILHVTAKDRDTGKEQGITITESTNLDRSEVERMLAEADRNREADKRLREAIDARNELDAAAYRVERKLAEVGDNAPVHDKARAEGLVIDARNAITDETPLSEIRTLTQELQQLEQALSIRATPPGGAPGAAGGHAGAPSGGGSSDDDVIDADFTRT
jgi:molecular chaperone DnaK